MNPAEPADTPATPASDRLAEVLRLTAALSDRVLDAQIMKQSVPDDQVRALAASARLLREHDVEWPPLLAQVLHELALKVENDPPGGEDTEAEDDAKVSRLNRFLGAFRKDKGTP